MLRQLSSICGQNGNRSFCNNYTSYYTYPGDADFLAPSPTYGKLYYDTGELWYEGYYEAFDNDNSRHYPSGMGILYFKDGKVYKVGRFGVGGLLEGRIYYPSGQLKFEGEFNSKKGMTYYGPTYPVRGKFWLEDGTLAYEGEFKVVRQGNLGYPKVIVPENFGSLD